MLKAPHMLKTLHIMMKVQHIMLKPPRITMKVQRIMMKAQHVKNIDHIRQSWLSINMSPSLIEKATPLRA